VTENEAEEIGLIVRRLWILGLAWKASHKKETLAQWLERLSQASQGAGLS
jgi:hypothetical protein